ncbi:MAG TPA: pyrroloquinoline quinone biosynthesis peptide chaperone PqqD [Rhizomicrobium sp.]|nr:pyrroloquinoline quinone biosynthesis peptide chaperone PqqD [Rhizomicrobium sp.]
MSGRLSLTDDCVPRLAPHMRLRRDTARGQWSVQAPERSFLLDEIAHTVIARCDGQASLSAIIDGLSADFAAPRDVIAQDVTALLQGLADKGVVTT